MPTINQLIRKGRKSKGSKSNSPALNFGYNSYKKVQLSSTKTWCCNSCWYNDT